MNAPVFAYGTLEFAEVVRFVTGRDFEGEPGLLRGHARYAVRGVSYPGVVPERGVVTPGTVYEDVDPATLARLDDYEASFYERRWLPVERESGRCEAWVWVVKAPLRDRLTSERWSPEDFARDELDAFLRSLGAR